MEGIKPVLQIGSVHPQADGGAIIRGAGVLACAGIRVPKPFIDKHNPVAGGWMSLAENDADIEVLPPIPGA